MSEVSTKCQRCGGLLSVEGWCQSCSTDQRQAADVSAAPGHDEVSLPDNAQTKTPPAGAHLINQSTGDCYSLSQSVSKIGRDETNGISLPQDSYISRHHAWILFIKGDYWVEDLGSTNGTLLNGELLTGRKQMAAGDRVKLGRTELIFQLG